METKTLDIYSKITNQIIEAIEQGLAKEKHSLPWYPIDNQNPMPRNVVSRQGYRGINILILWASAEKNNYKSGVWGTFKQWQSLGANVKKGEKATHVVYSEVREKELKEGDKEADKYFIMRSFYVFNIAQVENYETSEEIIDSKAETSPETEAFFNSLNPKIIYSGDSAFYSYTKDYIQLPKISHFKSFEDYYSVLSHEMVHWTAHESRLNRTLRSRFGSDDYAMEELIAELGAAFLCSELRVTNEPRNDHATYINSWLEVLKRDKKAIFTAATKAQQAVEWMKENQQQTKAAA